MSAGCGERRHLAGEAWAMPTGDSPGRAGRTQRLSGRSGAPGRAASEKAVVVDALSLIAG